MRDVTLQEDYLVPISWSLESGNSSDGAAERYSFYEGYTFPFEMISGKTELTGYNTGYISLLEQYNNTVTSSSPFEAELLSTDLGDGNYDISATFEVTEARVEIDCSVIIVLTQWNDDSNIDPWFFRVVGNSDLQDLSISEIGETATFNATFDLSQFDISHTKAVAFVQGNESKMIYQSVQIDVIQELSLEEEYLTENNQLYFYPNPLRSNENGTISYSVKNSDLNSIISIYNVRGQKVKTIVNEKKYNGKQSVEFSVKELSSGIYFSVFKNGLFTQSTKFLLIK